MKPSTAVVRTLAVLGLCSAVWLHQPVPVGAQSGITITSPAVNAVLRAGLDYATDTLGDAWDFSNRADVAIDPAQIDGFSAAGQNDGVSGFSVAGGLAGGTTSLTRGGANNGSNFYLLQRAYYTTVNPGRTGRRFPIDPATYSKLAFKMTSGRSDQFPRVFWFHNDLGDPAGDAAGVRLVPENNLPAPSGTNIFVIDLNKAGTFLSGAAWTSGVVKGFAMFPNSSAVSYPVQFDWVRLIPGDSHPAVSNLHITWTGTSSNVTIQVVDASNTTLTVATGVSGNAYDWNYGVLPPGAYTLKVGTATRTFTINTPPTITVTDPDETGGEDFATTVLGNPWDMNDQLDVIHPNVNIADHLLAPSFSNGIFTATSDGVPVAYTSGGIPVGDPQVYLLSNQSDANTTNIVNTQKYHRLTFSVLVDHAFDLQRGSVARVFWGSASSTTNQGGTPYNVTTSKDIITWPGSNSYTIDLAALTTAPDGGLELTNATPWTAKNVRHFRIDPLEFGNEQVTFHYGPVKLAADDETTNDSFTIHFTGTDPDNTGDTVALYYDTDQNPGAGLTLITSGIALGAGQYIWNTSQVPSGTYYIYAVASDGLNSVGHYSSGPVKVSSSMGANGPSNPILAVDTPAPSATVTSAFEVGGWAVDQGAASGTGVDAVSFYIFPNDGAAPPVFIGVGKYGAARPDVGAILGSRFTNSGFHFTITGMGPGNFVLGAYAHSTVTNSYTIVKLVHITVNAYALMSIDVPTAEATITSPTFGLSGWAIDRAAASGIGVDTIHVYAYRNPGSGQAAIFLGVATLGISRPDVGALYGSRFTTSGYVLQIDPALLGLTPGLYNIVPVAHSTATNTFNNLAIVQVTIQ
jgi:hypothetical protein